MFIKYVYNIYGRLRKYQQKKCLFYSLVLYEPLNISLYLYPSHGFLSLLLFIVLPSMYVSRNSILFDFACFWTLYKWYHLAYGNFLCLWGSSILKGIAVVYLFSLLYIISLVVYTRIHLPSILLVDVWIFSSFFAFPSHAVMKILIHVFWCTYPRISLRYLPNVNFYLQFHCIMPSSFLSRSVSFHSC